ncbi:MULTISPECIES: hypothetical protein [Bacillaceae]|uniref:hypothetical protein n=1 Tax=Bacillaceae TaxID=186817 RepID=UPI000BA65940|nr:MULTISPECIES: hypothetical protein [Bacillaceae]PAE24959.1 hypothetical protein CHI10_09940 [Bacillus sp. 7894-2]URM32604.1 hypothetical protein LLY41_20060 [Cytobacillus firmus]
MESKLNQLRRAMDSTTHKGEHFTKFQKMNIRKALHSNRSEKPKKPHKFVIIAISTLAICLLAFFVSIEIPVRQGASITLPEDIPDFVQESDFDTIDWERKAVEFGDRGIIGNENKSGVIGADMPSLNGQKWMWHLWGVENADLTIVGFHKESQTVHPILTNGMGWTIRAYGPINGADAHTPSSVKFPKKGEWAILLYVDGELFDELIYDINE